MLTLYLAAKCEWHPTGALDGCAPLQVVPDVLGVDLVEPLEFLVELLVALVDVVHVGVGVVHPPPAELLALLHLKWKQDADEQEGNGLQGGNQMHISNI